MSCTPFNGNGFTGWICGPDYFVGLEKYGAPKFFMSFHKYLGPTFYRGAEGPAIMKPGKKLWDAFGAWHAETFKQENMEGGE